MVSHLPVILWHRVRSSSARNSFLRVSRQYAMTNSRSSSDTATLVILLLRCGMDGGNGIECSSNSRKGGIFLCRQLGQQGTYNDQNQSYEAHRYKTPRRKVSPPPISRAAVIEVRGCLNHIYGIEDAAQR